MSREAQTSGLGFQVHVDSYGLSGCRAVWLSVCLGFGVWGTCTPGQMFKPQGNCVRLNVPLEVPTTYPICSRYLVRTSGLHEL